MEALKENYRRAAYADYSSQGTMELRNALSTTSRLFINRMLADDGNKKNTSFI